MGLVKQFDIERTWGSHQPLVKAVMRVLKPQTVVECGCGDFSTPHLTEAPNLFTIEHNQYWGDKMKEKYPNHNWKIRTFNAKNPTRIDELPPGEYKTIYEYYENLAKQFDHINLLFVDTFTACRVPAILNLGPKATYIILHDVEPPGPIVYSLDKLDTFFRRWNKYIHRPLGKIGGNHPIPWTGFFSRAAIPLQDINAEMEAESIRLWDKKTILEVNND